MKLNTSKGMRDFGPEEKILRDSVIKNLVEIFEIYGYSSLETPIVERYDVLSAKFGAGEGTDVMKEIFKLTDQGKRKLGLRFDLTVPFARYIAMNPTLKMPFKRYQIGEVFRDGPIKLGRYREFWQCDVDVVGSKNMLADSELVKLALDFFSKIKLDAYVEVNNRKILQSLILSLGFVKKDLKKIMIILDKLTKFGINYAKKELSKFSSKKDSDKLISLLSSSSLNTLTKIIKDEEGLEGLKELKEFFSYFGKGDNVKLNLALTRGFGYYTGTVFEGFLKKSKIKSSICGGGRYDDMIGDYIGKGEYPAVGISFGLDVISESLKLNNTQLKKTKTKVYVIPINTPKQSVKILDELRKSGINSDIDLVGRGISKNLDYANKMKIPYVLIIGPKELEKNKLSLKNLDSGNEISLNLEKIIKKLKI
jgi:histidyl-tRNA synthetase